MLVLMCLEETSGRGEGCAMKRVEQTMFLQNSRPLLGLQEELKLHFVSLSPTTTISTLLGLWKVAGRGEGCSLGPSHLYLMQKQWPNYQRSLYH